MVRAFVGLDDDPVRGDFAFLHLEPRRLRAVGEQAFSTAWVYRIYLQPEFIDRIMLEESLDEVRATVDVQVRPPLSLGFGNFIGDITVQEYGRLPFVRGQGIRGDVFGRRGDERPEGGKGTDPTAVRESAADIFLRPARASYDAVKGNELKRVDFSHDVRSFHIPISSCPRPPCQLLTRYRRYTKPRAKPRSSRSSSFTETSRGR